MTHPARIIATLMFSAGAAAPSFAADGKAMPETAQAAFAKYGAAVHALTDYFGTFVSLSETSNQTSEAIAGAEAKFDLAMCLRPSAAEQDMIVAAASERSGAQGSEIREAFFKPFDRFDCMNVADASTAIFELAASQDALPFDFGAVTSAHMKACS